MKEGNCPLPSAETGTKKKSGILSRANVILGRRRHKNNERKYGYNLQEDSGIIHKIN